MSWFVNNYHPRQYVLVRVLLGAYLVYVFGSLLLYATQLFSIDGVIPNEYATVLLSPFVPDVLYDIATPVFVQVVLVGLLVAAGLFLLGWQARLLALLMYLGWVYLAYLNPLSADPAGPYVGLLLLVFAIVPPPRTTDKVWNIPPILYWGLWVVLAVSFTVSGLEKLGSELWRNGTAVSYFCSGYPAYDSWVTSVCAGMPAFTMVVTWVSLYTQVFAIPMILFTWTRRLWWGVTTLLFIGICFVVAALPVFLGMLLFLTFIMERWWWNRFVCLFCKMQEWFAWRGQQKPPAVAGGIKQLGADTNCHGL